MSVPAFVAADYPGPRPDGPVLVRDGRVEPLSPTALEEVLVVADGRGAIADGRGSVADGRGSVADGRGSVADGHQPVAEWRFSVAYGSNASPSRLVQKGLDRGGALLLPAVLRDHVAGFEQRRTGYGSVPLTLLPAPGATTSTWVLGIPASATDLLDRTEGRVTGPAPTTPGVEEPGGRFAPPGTYQLGHVGPVIVADRWQLVDGLAYLPGPGTRVQLAVDGHWRTWPDVDQAAAARHVDAGGPARAAPRPARVVQGAWPATPLRRLA